MKHSQLSAATLTVNGDDMPLLYADIVIVERDNTDTADWECVAASRVDVELDLAPYQLGFTTIDGPSWKGDAVVVRTDGRGHVFRGVGPLTPA